LLALPPEVGLRSRVLGLADEAILQELLSACGDYFELILAQPAPAAEARNTLTEVPPGHSLEAKHVVGLFAPEGLRGIVDFVRGYRTEKEWYLGFLLLHPAWRSGGRGGRIVEALAAEAARAGMERVRLAAAEQNPAARRFWESCGFREDRIMPPRTTGLRQTVLVEMVRPLQP